jgi:hypothetical protein
MEKVEAKKSLERNKAIIIFVMIFLFLLIPSLILEFSDKKELFSLTLVGCLIALLYKRIKRLNYKLNSMGPSTK